MYYNVVFCFNFVLKIDVEIIFTLNLQIHFKINYKEMTTQ